MGLDRKDREAVNTEDCISNDVTEVGSGLCNTSWMLCCNGIAHLKSLACRVVESTSQQARITLCPSDGIRDEIEIVEQDLSYIKCEIKEEDDDGKVDKVINDHKVYQRAVSVEHHFAKDVAFLKRKSCNLRASERMLIVQCPGCVMEFRGSSNRMLRLIDHIKKRHHRFIDQYVRLIERRYCSLMGKRREKSRDPQQSCLPPAR